MKSPVPRFNTDNICVRSPFVIPIQQIAFDLRISQDILENAQTKILNILTKLVQFLLSFIDATLKGCVLAKRYLSCHVQFYKLLLVLVLLADQYMEFGLYYIGRFGDRKFSSYLLNKVSVFSIKLPRIVLCLLRQNECVFLNEWPIAIPKRFFKDLHRKKRDNQPGIKEKTLILT